MAATSFSFDPRTLDWVETQESGIHSKYPTWFRWKASITTWRENAMPVPGFHHEPGESLRASPASLSMTAHTGQVPFGAKPAPQDDRIFCFSGIIRFRT